MALGVADQGGDIVGVGEEGVGEDLGTWEGEGGDGLGAEGDLVEVGGQKGCHGYVCSFGVTMRSCLVEHVLSRSGWCLSMFSKQSGFV